MALSVSDVRAALTDGDEAVRQGAVARLDLAAPGAMELLVFAMADHNWRVRREAVTRAGSGTLAADAVIAALVPVLGEEDNVGLRNAAIEVVVNLGARSAPWVEASIASPIPKAEAHRKVLCDVLGRVGAASSGAVLTPFLHDPDANVQIAAAEALGRIPGSAGTHGEVLTARLLEVAASTDRAREFLGTALLEAIARHRAKLPNNLVAALVAEPVLGTAVLRAIGSSALVVTTDPSIDILAVVTSQLEGGTRVRRESAIVALARLLPVEGAGPPLSMPQKVATTEALLEGTVEVQRAAAAVLGACGTVDVARALLVAADDSALLDSVERALSRLARRDPTALATMAGTMTSQTRAAVYRVIASSLDAGNVELPPTLMAALVTDASDEDGVVAVAAMRAIGQLGGAAAAEVLAAALEAAHVQRVSIEETYERSEAARRGLQTLFVTHPAAVRAAVRARASLPPFALLVGQLGSEEDAAALLARLRDPDTETRRAAAAGMAVLLLRSELELSDAEIARASEAAGEALLDEAPEVRAVAVQTLAAAERRFAVKGGGTIVALLRATRDEDLRVRGAAVRALVDLVPHVTPEVGVLVRNGLRTLADASDELTAVPALESLLATGDPADDARLVDALTTGDVERRKVALVAMAKRPRLVLRGDLLRVVDRALHDERWDIRRAAVSALSAVGDIGKTLLEGRRGIESDPLVRADLDRALGGALDEGSSRRG